MLAPISTSTHWTAPAAFAAAMEDRERLYNALKAALPLLEGWADEASNDVGACVQEGGRPTVEELARMTSAAALANNALDAIQRAEGVK